MSYNYSIIIPHKNIPQLLERCLASIPIYDDIQIIIVDDNSSPTEVDFTHFPGFGKKNVEIYFPKEGKGAGYARNIGISHATGKWIIFADADDYFNDCFKEVLRLYTDRDYDVILFPFKTVNSETLQDEQRESDMNLRILSDQYNNSEKLILTATPWSKIIKRELIRINQIRFDEIPYANDNMFGVKVGATAKHILVDTKHHIYTLTVRNNSLITNRSKEALRCRLHVSINYNQYLKKNHYTHLLAPPNGTYFILWASSISKKEAIRTFLIICRHSFSFRKKFSYTNYIFKRMPMLLHKIFSI